MTLNQQRSSEIFKRGLRTIPGGVNSPVRAFRAVQGSPVVVERGKGAHIWDADGNDYVDYVGSWGPLILGHAPEPVLAAIAETAAKGTSFGAATEREVLFAELLVRLVPSIEKVRLVNSGTEATMSALRLARGYTRRNLIVKVVGGYHGHADYLLVRAGSGATTLGIPDSAGVPPGSAADTLLMPYNNLEAARELIARHPQEIAAIIIEPVAGNMGVVPPAPGYLQGLRELTQQAGALLIFDEVITGFRLALGGAQELYGVTPDLTCLGKTIGGGLPVGAYGGRAEVMDQVAPDGPVYQAGTLSGNPLAVAAGMATLEVLEHERPYDKLEAQTQRLIQGLRGAAEHAGLGTCINQVGSMFTLFFRTPPVRDFDGATGSDTRLYGLYHHAMLQRGVYLAPSQFEAAFLSTAHSDEDLDRTVEAAREALTAAGAARSVTR